MLGLRGFELYSRWVPLLLSALDRSFVSPFVTKSEGCIQTEGKHTVCKDKDLIQLLVHCIVHSV